MPLNEGDDHHEPALACLASFEDGSSSLVTHDYVVVETTALVQVRLGMPQVRGLHEGVLPALTIRSVDQEVRRAGVAALLAANRRDVSLVDWISFEMMRREGIEVAYAFDDGFLDQGFVLAVP